MRNYRTIDEVIEEYLRNHPEEIDDYISILFEEYAQDGDAVALLSSLDIVGRVKGVNIITESFGLNQKRMLEEQNPLLSSINTILRTMGYWLAPQKLAVS